MSYQQCTRFRTSLDFDHEYLWNGSSNRQAENGVINHDFFPRLTKTIWWTLAHLRKNHFDLCPMTLKLNRVPAVVNVHIHANIIKLSAAVHELSCTQVAFALSRMVKNPKIRSCDLDLWFSKSVGFLLLFKYMFLQNFIELCAAVQE